MIDKDPAALDFDLIVIGAGSGGVRAANVAANHGARVAIIEEHRVGGTCVIRGCVPKKLLAYGSHFAEDLKDARRFGWKVPECGFDWRRLRDNVLDDVQRLEGLMTDGLLGREVKIFSQRASLTGPNQVTLADGTGLTADKILVAVGATPQRSGVPGDELAITSNDAFHLEAVPKRMAIIGGGYIANEFAGIFHQFGAEVTIICRSPQLIMAYDTALRDRLLALSIGKGINVEIATHLERFERGVDGTVVVHTRERQPQTVDMVLLAVGRSPNTSALGLETVCVETNDCGAIVIDEEWRTSVPSIFAVGDVTNRIQLTPVAIREGHAFADSQFGGMPRGVDYHCVPSAVFSNPPVAAVGLTEEKAREQYGEVAIHTSDFLPLRNALAGRKEHAFYKLVCHSVTGRVLGLHMIGPDAPEILQAAAVAVTAGLTKDQFADTLGIFPTMAEELVEMA